MSVQAQAELIDVARLHARRDIRVAREPLAGPQPGDARLRVTAVGLCGSDIHWYEEGSIGDARLERPLVLGHEFAGVIEDCTQAGARVVADPNVSCGACEPCRSGNPHLCLNVRFAGHGTTDGALRAVMMWPRRLLYPIPDSIDDDEAPLLEPLGIAVHALDLARLDRAGRAAVFGCGPLGLLLTQLLRFVGASAVLASDPLAHRLVAAERMGATGVFEAGGISAGSGSGTPDSANVALKAGGGSPGRDLATPESVDVAFEVSGDDEALADAIRVVRPGGRIVLIGIPPFDRTSFAAAAARRKELSLVFCRRMHPADLPRAIRLTADGAVDLAALITDRYPITEAPAAFASLAARRGLKVIVHPNAHPSTRGDT